EAMGPDESKHALLHCPAGTWPGQTKRIADDTHFSTYGAYMIARMVVNQLIARGNSCGALFRTLPAYDYAEWHWNPSPRVNPEKPEGN
ncbi:MAG: rhamnogalacturonan acetylesterase, partial [Paludibacteraceae bacterium]|nr:rhamnogalacturonan acetylesterase [Paludibacteraceae bacterium]